jgi:hypothetical protein
VLGPILSSGEAYVTHVGAARHIAAGRNIRPAAGASVSFADKTDYLILILHCATSVSGP